MLHGNFIVTLNIIKDFYWFEGNSCLKLIPPFYRFGLVSLVDSLAGPEEDSVESASKTVDFDTGI